MSVVSVNCWEDFDMVGDLDMRLPKLMATKKCRTVSTTTVAIIATSPRPDAVHRYRISYLV